MNDAYKIAVVGPIPRDHIKTHEGEEVEKYGCVLYPVAVLSSLLPEGSTIYPVSNVLKCDEENIKNILKELKYVDFSYVSSEADQGDVINLVYTDQNNRLETQTGFMNPILPKDLENLIDCDIFVFVPVTDFEISLEVLKFIKAKSEGLVIFDAHGPTNTVDIRGHRNFQFWIDRDVWLPYIDVLKMNLEEAACCWFRSEYTPEALEQISSLPFDEVPKFARHCLSLGVKAVYITLNEKGSVVYYEKNGKVKEKLIKRIEVEEVVDTTGCGDSFAGGLAFGYLRTKDWEKACYYANAVGAQRCSGVDLLVYKDLAETEAQIAETYGD